MPRKSKTSRRSWWLWGLAALGVFAFLLVLLGWPWYRALERPNTRTPKGNPVSIFVRDTCDFEDLIVLLREQDLLLREQDFRRVAKLMKYGPAIKPGHYLIRDSISNRELITPLRQGHQDPVRVTFTRLRHTDRLAAKVATKLSLDSAGLADFLRHPDSLLQVDLTRQTALGAFLPNTYEFWWNTNERQFVKRMLRERDRFWQAEGRLEKAGEMGLTPEQVTVLASIVEEEQNALPDEWPTIAGLYLNRLRKGMPLEADPTIKFAMGRFDLKRVYLSYIEETADSPFNTYRNPGLPPGPICTPSPRGIDAVLHAQDHDYLFMCAKADFSGYHAFAVSHNEHIRNRNLYTAALNRRGIR